jgi:hypothetical protein
MTIPSSDNTAAASMSADEACNRARALFRFSVRDMRLSSRTTPQELANAAEEGDAPQCGMKEGSKMR